MEDLNPNPTEEGFEEQTLSLPPQSSKKSWLRIVASLLTLIATLSYWVWVGIIAYIVFARTAGVADLFGYKWDVLGIVTMTGMIAYLVLFLAVAMVASFALGCTLANLKYRRMVRASNKYEPALFAVSNGAVVSIIYLYGSIIMFLIIWGLIMIWTGIHNPVGYTGIVCMVLQAVASVVATLEYILCKYKFEGLSQEERHELRSYSHVLKGSIKKAKKKRRIGKLY
ncbi:MAG: hypothetical protein J1G07_03485 [Clostridiales bacterium]|nr:hypothetical protein [Clostridiales bacterium]